MFTVEQATFLLPDEGWAELQVVYMLLKLLDRRDVSIFFAIELQKLGNVMFLWQHKIWSSLLMLDQYTAAKLSGSINLTSIWPEHNSACASSVSYDGFILLECNMTWSGIHSLE